MVKFFAIAVIVAGVSLFWLSFQTTISWMDPVTATGQHGLRPVRVISHIPSMTERFTYAGIGILFGVCGIILLLRTKKSRSNVK